MNNLFVSAIVFVVLALGAGIILAIGLVELLVETKFNHAACCFTVATLFATFLAKFIFPNIYDRFYDQLYENRF